MLPEQIVESNPDLPGGRIMSDGSSMFMLYVLEFLKWGGDAETARLYYPTVKARARIIHSPRRPPTTRANGICARPDPRPTVQRAAQWQLSVSEKIGLPFRLETTYDILKFPDYDYRCPPARAPAACRQHP